MSKVRRFYSVAAPRGKIFHRANTITEGNLTWCGRPMWLGWKHGPQVRDKRLRCTRCIA